MKAPDYKKVPVFEKKVPEFDKKHLKKVVGIGLVWLLCLVAYQFSWVI